MLHLMRVMLFSNYCIETSARNKNGLIFNTNINTRHSERSEESMQAIDITGFFATLRMTD